jgi:hypothetical protein
MIRVARLLAALVLVGVIGARGDVRAADSPGRQPVTDRLEKALHYDFFLGDGARVNDASGQKHDGLLVAGAIVEGRRRNAVTFDGKGMIRVVGAVRSLNPVGRALTIGAVCNPRSADGVIAAMGDQANGFSLYLKHGFPQFAVRNGGKLTRVADTEPIPLDPWTHLIGGIDESGEVWLIVNGFLTAHAKARHIAALPSEPLCIGADPGAPVGEYPSPANWQGMLQEVRLYWGFIDLKANREEMKDWADLSGCGCK